MNEKWGSSRWAEDKEIKEDLKKSDIRKDDNLYGGMAISRDKDGNLYVDPGENFNMVIGATGSGKTRFVLLPSIYSIIRQERKSHLIIYDPKAEILKYTKYALDKAGYRTIIFNLKDMSKRSDHYNPLYLPAYYYKNNRQEEAIQMFYDIAETIFPEDSSVSNDLFWVKASMNYATGLFITAAELLDPENVNFNSVYALHLVGNKGFGPELYFNRVYRGREEAMGYRLLAVLIDAAPDTRRSIISVFSEGYAKLISNRSLIDTLSGIPSITPEEMAGSEQPVAVFILVNDSGTYAEKAASMIVEQFYQILIRVADNNCEGCLPRRVEFVLDEFSTLRLQDCNQKISAARSRNLRFTFAIQGLKQLALVYGQETASIILANVGNLLYLSSTDLDLQKYLQDRAGTQITTYTQEKRPLLSVADLQHIKKGSMVVFRGSNYPYLSNNLVDISRYHVIEETFDINLLDERVFMPSKDIDMNGILKQKVKESINKEMETAQNRQSLNSKRKERRKKEPKWSLLIVPENGLYYYKDGDGGHVSDKKDLKYYEIVYSEEMVSSEILILFFSENEDDRDGHCLHVALYNLAGPKVRKTPLKSLDEGKSVKDVRKLLEHVEDIVSQMNMTGDF